MVEWWSVIYGVVIMWIAFGALFYRLIESKTKYKGNTQGDMDMGIITPLSIFLGPIMFLFLNPIRRYRKHRYLRKRINYYRWQNNFHMNIPPPPPRPGGSGVTPPTTTYVDDDPIFKKEIDRMERVLKISLLHQQSKRNRLKKLLFLNGRSK